MTVRKGTKNKAKPLWKSFCIHVFFIVICVALLNRKHEQGMIKGWLSFCVRELNTCRSFCLEKRWSKRVWWAPVRSQAAKRMWLQSIYISNWRAENLGWIQQGKICTEKELWNFSGSSWLISCLTPHNDLSASSSTFRLNALAKDPL